MNPDTPPMRQQVRGLAMAFTAGLLFGLGLAVAQMTDPSKVLAFLDVAGDWDPSLAFVMGAAVTVTALGFHRVRRWARPSDADRFHLPTARRIDARLLVGAGLFGIGWGLTGYCPGPALAVMFTGNPEVVWFVPGLLAGGWFYRRFNPS